MFYHENSVIHIMGAVKYFSREGVSPIFAWRRIGREIDKRGTGRLREQGDYESRPYYTIPELASGVV
jgi:hypothetical protein